MDKFKLVYLIIIKSLIFSLNKLNLFSIRLNDIRNSLIYSKFNKRISDPILQSNTESKAISKESPIWIMWWQGETEMPDIVKICYNRLKQTADRHPVILLHQENITNYVSSTEKLKWNSIIDNSLKNGQINLTKYSDLLRCFLLYNYGGIWIDSTVFLTKSVDDIIGSSAFYTVRHHPGKNFNEFCVEGKWTGFFVGCHPFFDLMKFIYQNMVDILIRDHCFKEYFTIDYLFMIAYNNNIYLQDTIENLPLLDTKFTLLNLNEIYTPQTWHTYLKESPLYKLSWKKKYYDYTPENKKTIFSHLKDQIN